MKDLGIEIVELRNSAESTGNRVHIEELNVKKATLADFLGMKAQVWSWFQNTDQMDAPSKFFFSLEKKNGQGRFIHT